MMVMVADPVITVEVDIVGGLIGLGAETAYRMMMDEETGVCWLEPAEDAAFALPCVDAAAAGIALSLELSDEVADALDLRDPWDARVLLVVHNWDDPALMTVGLRGPIVLNTRNNRARQIVAHLTPDLLP